MEEKSFQKKRTDASNLGFISKNSQNYRNIYSVKDFSCSRLHAKSTKSKFRIIPKNISCPHRQSDFLYALYCGTCSLAQQYRALDIEENTIVEL